MGITIHSMSWRDNTKRVAYSKKGNAYAERYTFETRDDARPELFDGFKALQELVVHAYKDILREDVEIIPERIAFLYQSKSDFPLINAVKIKCRAQGHASLKEIAFEAEINIAANCPDREHELVALVREIGLFVLGNRAQTTFEFAEQVDPSQINIYERAVLYPKEEICDAEREG